MIYKAYELLAHLDNLILTDGKEGQIEWIGKKEDWKKVDEKIDEMETFGLRDEDNYKPCDIGEEDFEEFNDDE